jgi:methylmalonyl-CoA/ethylmalonyl-CoA epimerase
MKHIEHIGIAVKDLDEANKVYAKLFGKPSYKTEVVESESVKTSFFKVGNQKIELLEGLHEESIITKYIEKKGEGVHHIAFEVDNINQEIERLKQEGFVVLSDTPKQGADNKLVVFLHPKSAHGVLIELCQEII